MLLAARSPLHSSTTTSCSTYPTSNDGNPPWLSSNNSTTNYCDDISNEGVLVLTLCIAGPLLLFLVISIGYVLIQTLRSPTGRRRSTVSPNPDSDPAADQSKIDFDGKGGGDDDDGSATCVNVPNNNQAGTLAGEVDISSSSLSYNHHPPVMPFLRKGLFRATSFSSSSSSSSSQAGNTTRGRGPTPPPPAYSVQATAPASSSGSGRLRSLSESSIVIPDFDNHPGSRAPLSTSLPSSPSIPPPPPTGTGTGTTASGCNNPGAASSTTTFSLSLSEKLERLNKQMMKKTSISSLRGMMTTMTTTAATAVVTPEPEQDYHEEGSSSSSSSLDTSLDFKCRGLPESGTFSALTDLEAAMRVEDELATMERLASRM